MREIAQKTDMAVKTLFDRFVLVLFLLGITAAIATIWQQQNQLADNFISQEVKPEHISSLVKVSQLSSGDVLYSQSSQPRWSRDIVIEHSDLKLAFEHPILILLFSPVFYLFISSSVVAGIVIRRQLTSVIERQLSSVSAFEDWAQQSQIEGTILPMNERGIVADTIKSVIEQLNQAKIAHSQAGQNIREQALLDRETDVGNREFFTNRLEAYIAEEDAHGAVLLINFKELEATQSMFGYSEALQYLNTYIGMVQSTLKNFPNYFIARRAEFELAVLLPNTYLKDAKKHAKHLLNGLSKLELPIGTNQQESCHIGMSYFHQQQRSYQVMAEADMALRSAQLQGPSQWFMYDAGEVANDSAKGSLKWRTFLTRAIENNAFVLFFQPVIERSTSTILHHEVLSKVRDSRGKLISARVFLPMAQKCGLASEVDILVFEQTCRLLQYEKKQHDICSLNISVDSLLSEPFLERFLARLSDNPEIAGELIIEVSEYHLVSNLAKLKPVLELISDLGAKILADKVGQYVVNLDYLSECPIRYVKLHRSIVHHVQERIENQVFIQSLSHKCNEHKIAIYALGVESESEWNTLTRLGVIGGQGHYFTEPVAQMAQAIEWQ